VHTDGQQRAAIEGPTLENSREQVAAQQHSNTGRRVDRSSKSSTSTISIHDSRQTRNLKTHSRTLQVTIYPHLPAIGSFLLLIPPHPLYSAIDHLPCASILPPAFNSGTPHFPSCSSTTHPTIEQATPPKTETTIPPRHTEHYTDQPSDIAPLITLNRGVSRRCRLIIRRPQSTAENANPHSSRKCKSPRRLNRAPLASKVQLLTTFRLGVKPLLFSLPVLAGLNGPNQARLMGERTNQSQKLRC
jgi:hypothetical protein